MATVDTIQVEVNANLDPVMKGLVDFKEELQEISEITDKVASDIPALNFLFEDGKFKIGEDFREEIIGKALDPTQKLSDFEKSFLRNIEDTGKVLKENLEAASNALRDALEEKEIDREIVDILVKTFEEGGKKRIDDLIEDFSDELEEAVKSLSKTLSDAFFEMALEGEFSARKIGDAFLRTALDLISKELIQKPLESLLGSLFKGIFGSASGGVIAEGVPTLINEQGQEIFIPHTPGRIVNAPDTRRMLEGGSPVVVNQNLNFDTAIKNDMAATIIQASPLIVEQTKRAVLESLRGRRV